MCCVWTGCTIAERTSCNWYAKLKNENFDFKGIPHFGHPVEFIEDKATFLQKFASNNKGTAMLEKIECCNTDKEKHLHSMRKVQKYGVWVPYANKFLKKQQNLNS